jgi:hypothetical protein
MAGQAPRSDRNRLDMGASAPGADVARGRDNWWFRVAALAGAAALPLMLTAVTLADVSGSGGLNPGSSDAQLVEVFREFRDRQLMAAGLQVLAAVAILVFLGPLWARVRVGSEALGVVAIGGGVAVAVLVLAWAGWSLVAVVAADFEDAGAARFLLVSGWETARLGVGPYLAMVGAVTVAGYRHHVFGRWFNGVGLIFTVLLTLGLVPASPAGLMGLMASLWVLCAALVIAFSAPPESKLRGPQRP